MCPNQLTCLNLSNNRIHKLDELAELVTKVPNLKTLNLSHNEVNYCLVRVENNKLPSACSTFTSSHPLLFICDCPVEVRPGVGQGKRPEVGGAVAEQEPSV